MEDDWMRAREAALLAGETSRPSTPGHLKVTGLDHRGRKLFRHLDVTKAEMATRAKTGRALVLAA